MPPCGYRSDAITGIEQFLADNLAYFRELYRPRGLSPLEAIAVEMKEIEAIESGARGGRWAVAAVALNKAFYEALLARAPRDWSEAEQVGRRLVQEAATELARLTHDGRYAA